MHKVLRALFKDQWPKLTDDDLDRANGQVARLTTLLEEKYGYPLRRAERELIRFLDDSMRSGHSFQTARSGPISTAGDADRRVE